MGVEPVRFLITIPCHNEVERIRPNTIALDRELRASNFDYQIALVEDGSTDGTCEEVLRLKKELPDLITQSYPRKLGRGRALARSWRALDFDGYCYTDADLPAGPQSIPAVLRALEQGAHVVTGSRYSPGAKVTRPPLVLFASRQYNRLIRLIFEDAVYDHQCGLKGFSREALRTLLPAVQDGIWFWDTEILVRAKHEGLRICEIPLDWVERRMARTSMSRLIKEPPYFLENIVRLSGQIHEPRKARAGSADAPVELPIDSHVIRNLRSSVPHPDRPSSLTIPPKDERFVTTSLSDTAGSRPPFRADNP
jgi:glycosyltransferase AglD